MRRKGARRALIVLENVGGVLTSKGGADFAAICAALQGLGYRFGALTIDAAHFLPQSRPRVFFVAIRRGDSPPAWLVSARPAAASRLGRAAGAPPPHFPPQLAADWLWWRAAGAAARQPHGSPTASTKSRRETRWHSVEQTERLLAALSPASRRDVALARASGERAIGALFRRTRPDGAGGVRVQAEARFDGLAGCLRTPGGGSSRQFLIVVEGERTRTRLMTPREAARLMGLPDSYVLPPRATDAFHLVGDGVCAAGRALPERALLLPLIGHRPETPTSLCGRKRA